MIIFIVVIQLGSFYSTNGNIVHCVGATSSTDRRSTVDAATLARRWRTSLATAASTLQASTTRAVRFYPQMEELSRRFRTRQGQLRYPHLRTRWYTDTMFPKDKVKSVRGHTCAQLFCNDQCWAKVYPMRSEADCGDRFNEAIRQYGIPELGIHSDNAAAETGDFTEFERVRKIHLVPRTTTEPHSPWMNRAESEIGQFKTHWRRIMNRYRCPDMLWCFAAEYTSNIRELMSRPALEGRSPYEVMTGETPDISEYTDFDFYQFVIYYDPNDMDESGLARRKLGRWLGPSKSVGQALCYYVLKANGRYIARSTVRPIVDDDYLKYPMLRDEMKEFETRIKEHVGVHDNDAILQSEVDEPEEEIFEATPDGILPTDEDLEEDPNGPSFDPLIKAQVVLPHKEGDMIAVVIKRKRDANGNLVGRKHRFPRLDSRVYEVEFLDGERQQIAYNILAEHLLSQVDEEGRQYQLFKEIVDHRRDSRKAVEKSDQYFQRNGKYFKKKTTTGWDLEVEWRDGSTSWLPLKTLKETNPIEVAEYAKANQIETEPAFDWWVPMVLRRKKRIIKATQSRHHRAGFKFGVQMPSSIPDAARLDHENGNTLWMDALRKEMSAVMIAFEVQPEKATHVPGYKKIPGHIVWDVKMDFTRKARYVAGGHRTDPPKAITYSSVVSRETIRIALLVAGLNGLNLRLTDIGNAYLTAPVTERYYVVAGDEFGPLKGRVLKIVRALYGLKSAGAAFRAHLASVLRDHLHFYACEADPDLWLRKATKPDGSAYYEYALVYVDDVMLISAAADELVKELACYFTLKVVEDPGTAPCRYLGAMVGQYQFGDGSLAWSMSAEDYLTKAIPTIEEAWDEKLCRKASSPLPAGYHPEIDVSPLLSEDDVSLYASYIGILQWATELARIDLMHSVALMSRFRNAPREGHMEAVLRIFGYVKGHLRSRLVFDPAYRDWTTVDWYDGADWKEFYPDAVELIPPGAPEALGNEVQINIFCDAAHATCLATRRSTTGVLIFLNGAAVRWYSKRQNTVETSTFGSEFVAMKIAIEMNDALRYKLRMMGVPIDGAANVFGDNASVVKKVTRPESTLNKRHNAIAYHKCCEACACGSARVAHEPGKANCSDGLTKILTGVPFYHFARSVLY